MFSLPECGSSIVDYKVTLNNGLQIPLINFGTFQITGHCNILSALDNALGVGIRGIDTAAVYGNESDIGAALKVLLPRYNLRREDIFITTKLDPSQHGDMNKVSVSVDRALQKLNTTYIDLFLIHYPGTTGYSATDPRNQKLRSQTWKALTEIYTKQNKLKAIGVSNYTDKHLKELLSSSSVCPAVNQVEFHPHWQQSEILQALCQKHNILLQAYSALGGMYSSKLLKDPLITSIAKTYNISSAQVLLRWAIQRGYCIVVKSSSKERLSKNIDLKISLSPEHVEQITNIGYQHKYAWNPEKVA